MASENRAKDRRAKRGNHKRNPIARSEEESAAPKEKNPRATKAEAKRARAAAPVAPAESETRILISQAARKPRPHKPRDVGRPTLSEESVTEIAQKTTLVVLALLNTLVGTLLGEKRRMNDFERSAIQDSMQATLEELDIAQAALVARYMNPILLLMSVVGWGARVVREIREEQEQGGQDGDGPPPAPKDETPGPGGNGRQREPIPPEEPAAPQVIVEGIRIVPIEQLRRPAEADIFNGEGGG